MPTVEYLVAASADDVLCRTKNDLTYVFSTSNASCRAGDYASDYHKYGSAMRFIIDGDADHRIPQGAIIDVAYLKLRASSLLSTTTVRSHVWCDQADSSAQITDATDLYSRTAGTKVTWDITDAWNNEDHSSPSIVTPIEEIIHRVGWAPGNAINVFWEDFAGHSDTGAYRVAVSRDGSATLCPILHIEYHIQTNRTVFARRWFGPADAPGKVEWKGTETLGAAAPDKSTVTLNTLESYPHGAGWASDVERAYFSKRNPSAFKLIRYNPADNSWTTYTASSADYNMASDLCITGGKVYVVHAGPTSTSAYMSVFNTSDATPALVGSVHEYTGGGGGGETIVTDGTYLYIGTTVGKILLVDLTALDTVLDTLTLSTAGNLHAMEYNPSDGKVYGALASGDATYQISRSGTTLSQVKYVPTLPGGGSLSDDITVDATDLWCPIEAISTGQILRIPLTKFNDPPTGDQAVLTVGPLAVCYGIFPDDDGVYLWLVWGSSPGQLTRLKKSDLSTERIWFADAEVMTNEVVQYAPHKYLISTFTNPAQVINLTNPFPDIALEKPASGSNYSYWVPLRLYVETTGELEVWTVRAYTDGANGLGTGWTAIGDRATEYTEPTGTEGETGTVLNTTNYPTLYAAPADIFGWTSDPAYDKHLEGYVDNAATGDAGVYGADRCFLVIQLVAGTTVAGGLSAAEALTLSYVDGYIPLTKPADVKGKADVPASAALSGSGTITAGSTRVRPAAAILSGSGSIVALGVRVPCGKAVVSGSGTVVVGALRVRMAAGALSASGTVAAVGHRLVFAASALSASGTVAAIARPLRTGKAAISASGTVVAIGLLIAKAKAVLSGAGATVAVGRLIAKAKAVLSASGLVTVTGLRIRRAIVAISGNGGVVASISRTIYGAVALAASGILAAIPRARRSGRSVLSATGYLSAAAGEVAVKEGRADLSAMGALGASAGRIRTGAAASAASGTVSCVGRSLRGATSAVAGDGEVGVYGPLWEGAAVPAVRVRLASAPLAGSGTIVVIGTIGGIVEGSAVLAGNGTLVVIGSVGGIVEGSAVFSASGTVLVAGIRMGCGKAAVSGNGVLVVVAAVRHPVEASALLVGEGNVLGVARVLRFATLPLTGLGQLTAIGSLAVGPASAVLSGMGYLVCHLGGAATVIEIPASYQGHMHIRASYEPVIEVEAS